MAKCRSKLGMTLIELLIAMAITGMMIGVAFPAFNQYQKRSAYISDAENLVQLFSYARAYENNPDFDTRADSNSSMAIRFTNSSNKNKAELYSTVTGISKTIDQVDFLSDFQIVDKNDHVVGDGDSFVVKINGKNPTEKISCTGISGFVCDETVSIRFYKSGSSVSTVKVEIINTIANTQLFSVRINR